MKKRKLIVLAVALALAGVADAQTPADSSSQVPVLVASSYRPMQWIKDRVSGALPPVQQASVVPSVQDDLKHVPAPANPTPCSTYLPASAPCPCDNPCATTCCCPNPRWWVGADYLLWWVKPSPAGVPLITTGELPIEFSGAIGFPGTQIVQNAGDFGPSLFSGLRLTAGGWFDADNTLGAEVSGFLLESGSRTVRKQSDAGGNPIIGTPFFNTEFQVEDYADHAIPGAVVGGVAVSSSMRLWGVEANAIYAQARCAGYTVELLAGLRYVNLFETFQIQCRDYVLVGTESIFLNEAFGFPSGISVTDYYSTRNAFYGGQAGGRVGWQYGAATLMVTGKVGLGATNRVVRVSGRSDLFDGPRLFASTSGGLFAQNSNSGRFSDVAFTVLPEVELKLGYQLTQSLRGFVGYNFLYWSNVRRAGEQINRNVNPAQVPTFVDYGARGTAPPAAAVLKDGDFWAHGLSFGLVMTF